MHIEKNLLATIDYVLILNLLQIFIIQFKYLIMVTRPLLAMRATCLINKFSKVFQIRYILKHGTP